MKTDNINNKLGRESIAELDRYFSPNGYIVTKLPNEKTVRDNSEVYKENPGGTYDFYKMLKGKWVLINQNVANVEQVESLQKGGGSGVDYSSSIAANASNIATNAADISTNADDIAALENTAPAYVKTAVDYALPTANNIDSKIIAIKNISTGLITVECEGAEKIDGENTQTLGPDDCMMVMSDGSDWIIV